MGLETVLFGRWYYRHVAPTELAGQLPAATARFAGLVVVRWQFGILNGLLLPLQDICDMEIGLG